MLLPTYARHSDFDQPAIVRLLVEDVDVRRRRQDLGTSREPDLADMLDLGERLESHIRHEERVLFPLTEQALPAEELEQFPAAVARETDGE